MPRVVIDPDGSHENAAYALVLHSTDVHYAIQCAGYKCEERTEEGFLIPLGGPEVARPLMNWFWKTFHGHSYTPATEWRTEQIAQLRELVAQIACWHTDAIDKSDHKVFVELDETRLSECVEAWIPVRTPYGAGFMLFPNCD